MLKYNLLIILKILIFLPQVVFGDDTHYKDMLFGGRAAGMGGTYIAISDDAAGCFYNPAGTVYAYEDSISGSGNAFFSQKYNIEDIPKPLSEETGSYERVGESFLANFFGILRKHDDFTYCFVYLIPETNSEHQFLSINENVWQYELDWNLEDTSYLAGPSLAYSFSDSISWGLGLFYHYRSGRFNNTVHTNYDFDSDGIQDTSANFFHRGEIKEHGFLYKLGLQWNPVDEIVFGFVFDQTVIQNSLYTKVSSGTAYNWIYSDGYSGGYQLALENKSHRSVPIHYGFGAAYYPTPSTMYAFDIDYYSSTSTNIPFGFPNNNYTVILPFSQVESAETAEVINNSFSQTLRLSETYNYSLGLETYINAENSLSFGFFSNNTSAPDAGESTVYYYDHIDMIGLSGAYSSHTPNSTFTTGLVLTKGEGNLIVNHFLPRKINKFPLSRSSWALFIAVN